MKVPQPPYMPHYSARINAVAGLNCSEMARDIEGACWHTEVGGFIGTARWFNDPNNGALTDFQIGGSWDGQYNGVIMRFIEDDQGVSPYANGVMGKVRPPFDEGARFIAKYVPPGQPEQLNARARSMELSDGGQPNRDRSQEVAQMESLCYLTAYILAEEKGISYAEYRSGDIFLHYQTGTDHVDCPGIYVKTNKIALFGRTLDIMKAYQTDTPLDAPILITYPPGWTGGVIPQPGEGKPSVPSQQYPVGYDAGSCLKIWNACGAAKTYPQYQYSEGGTISTIWRNEGILSPLVYHHKDPKDGRELFVFASGDSIGRDNSTQPFRVMSAA